MVIHPKKTKYQFIVCYVNIYTVNRIKIAIQNENGTFTNEIRFSNKSGSNKRYLAN